MTSSSFSHPATRTSSASCGSALPDWEIDLVETPDEPVEDGETFLDNARIKARHGRAYAAARRMGRGRGLGDRGRRARRATRGRVRALGDATASRICSPSSTASATAARATSASSSSSDPDGEEITRRGTLEGEIALEPRGNEGFGYDPIFVPRGESRTVAELGNAWKAEHSHRAQGGTGARRDARCALNAASVGHRWTLRRRYAS